MKLVEKVLENISSENLQSLSSDFRLSPEQTLGAVNALIPGILSALKAKLFTGLAQGNTGDFLNIINDFSSENFNIRTLFSDNSEALTTLSDRISAFANIDGQTVKNFIPSALPMIMTAITQMLHTVGTHSLMATGSQLLGNFFTDKMQGSPYEIAIKSANAFLSSVFGGNTEEILSNTVNNDVANNNNFIQTVLDLFEQDNDGSVMDDIYHMLVK